jgi:hypothetical protein
MHGHRKVVPPLSGQGIGGHSSDRKPRKFPSSGREITTNGVDRRSRTVQKDSESTWRGATELPSGGDVLRSGVQIPNESGRKRGPPTSQSCGSTSQSGRDIPPPSGSIEQRPIGGSSRRGNPGRDTVRIDTSGERPIGGLNSGGGVTNPPGLMSMISQSAIGKTTVGHNTVG